MYTYRIQKLHFIFNVPKAKSLRHEFEHARAESVDCSSAMDECRLLLSTGTLCSRAVPDDWAYGANLPRFTDAITLYPYR